jgi:hypothetical protein
VPLNLRRSGSSDSIVTSIASGRTPTNAAASITRTARGANSTFSGTNECAIDVVVGVGSGGIVAAGIVVAGGTGIVVTAGGTGPASFWAGERPPTKANTKRPTSTPTDNTTETTSPICLLDGKALFYDIEKIKK